MFNIKYCTADHELPLRKMGGLLSTLAILMTGVKYHMTRNTYTKNTNAHRDSIHVF